jgi:L-seryl-tRNA(Ser) seleniumtransferase
MPDGERLEAPQHVNRFGHPIDPAVGYARGPILSSSLEEAKRRTHAMRLIQERATALGHDSFYNFTGLHRDYPAPPEKVAWGEEWVGPAFFWDELVELAREHFGGAVNHEVAAFNRCSAGIISTCLALARPGSTVASVVPGDRSHPSIGRGVRLAGAQLRQTKEPSELGHWLGEGDVSLIVITGVSSELQILDQDVLLEAVKLGRGAGVPVLLDDAYGTRLRPIIFGGLRTLETGVDVGVTACDKAGLSGPRAGLMVGEPRLMEQIVAKAAELGLEARPPLALGIWASLRQFDPNHLREEVELGLEIYERLSERFGPDRVIRSALGASIPAEIVYELVQATNGGGLSIVPAEVTAGIGLYWLEHHGIISVNALGQPGASIWLRFKPSPGELERFGGIPAMIQVLDKGLDFVAQRAHSVPEMERLILGK